MTTQAERIAATTRRREAMWDAVYAAPHAKWSKGELAEALGRAKDYKFNADLGWLRATALDRGDFVTDCKWDKQRHDHAFMLIPAGDERGESGQYLIQPAKVWTTLGRRLNRQAEYVKNNAELGDDAELALMIYETSAAAVVFGKNAVRLIGMVDKYRHVTAVK